MNEFVMYWNTEVKPLAIKCSKGAELIGQLENSKTEEERAEINVKMEDMNKVDWLAVFYISGMLYDVDHSLSHERYAHAGVNMLQVQGCLNSEDYYTDVFKENTDCEEYKNYRELGQKLNKIMEIYSMMRITSL